MQKRQLVPFEASSSPRSIPNRTVQALWTHLLIPLYQPFHPPPHSRPPNQSHNHQNIQRYDTLIFPTIPFETFGPNISFKPRPNIMICMLKLCAFTHLQSLIQTKLTGARCARFGWVNGRVKGDESGICLKACTFAQVEVATVCTWDGRGIA